MNSTNKKSPGARGIPEPFNRQAGHAPQFKSVVAQAKTAVSAQSVKQPVAPPVYRPQAKPAGVQAKMAAHARLKNHPVAPPVYRPQPVPRVLQTKKTVSCLAAQRSLEHRPLARPVPGAGQPARSAVQEKRASGISIHKSVRQGQQLSAQLGQLRVVQRLIDNMTHLEPIDLHDYTPPSSGRSGNIVLLGPSFVYKLFHPDKEREYNMEVDGAKALGDNGVKTLFHDDLGLRRVILPNGSTKTFAVIRMVRASGQTFMLAKNHIKPFVNHVRDKYSGNKTQLTLLFRSFRNASLLGLKDPQFIYEEETNTPYFMDIHLGGVKGEGDCGVVAEHIKELLLECGI